MLLFVLLCVLHWSCSVLLVGWEFCSCIGLSLALTSFFAKLGLALYASLGVHLRNLLRMVIPVCMADQCLRRILNAFLAVGLYLVTKVGLLVSSGASVVLVCVLFVLSALLALIENLSFFNCLLTWLELYPLLVRFLLC